MGANSKMTQKTCYFHDFPYWSWPTPAQLKPYFEPGEPDWADGGNDSWGFTLEGVGGDPNARRGRGRLDLRLNLWGDPRYGVLLWYHRDGIEDGMNLYSRGDMSKMGSYMRTLHDDPMPLGLFIPFEKAFLAVEDFINGEGKLSERIEWVPAHELPLNAFPDPLEDV